jgi:germination protein M
MRSITLAAALVALLAAACQPTASATPNPATPPPTEAASLDVASTEPTVGPTQAASAAPTGGETTTLRVYYMLGSFTTGGGLAPVLREVPKTQAVGTAALRALLAGPIEAELSASPAMFTAIPDGTKLLGLQIDGGVATVNLSKEFTSAEEAQSDHQRLAQVTYTLTQFASVTVVRFEVEGVPLTTLGSGGISLTDPVARATFVGDLPPIFVDRPAWGGVLGNPARLVGLADVFEAQFLFRIIDGGGHSVADGPIKATCGTGCLGTYDATIPYTVTAAGWGTLQVYELSAANSSVINLTEYPVWLTP